VEYVIVTSAVDEATASAWNACLDAADFATHYTAPEFFLENTFVGKRPFAVLAVDGEVINGVVTGVFDGHDMSCGAPGSPHVCVRRGPNMEQVGRVLAAGLRAHAGRPVQLISLHTWTEIPGLQSAGFQVQKFDVPMCTILLDLSKGKDWLFRHCSETRRNKIRRAIKAGVDIREMVIEEDFDEYYKLYSDWCGFKGVKCTPYERQRSIFAATANRLILVARQSGQMVGVSTFRFRKPGLVEYAANVSRREETRLRQNDLLLWRGIEWSVQQGGFTYFSMAGAHFFLQKFGGQAHPTYRYSLDRTILRRRHAVAGLRGMVTQVYQRLPGGMKRAAKKLLRVSGESD
jgi:hypothetical protein